MVRPDGALIRLVMAVSFLLLLPGGVGATPPTFAPCYVDRDAAKLPELADTAEGFGNATFSVVQSEKGNLDGDGEDDLVVLIRRHVDYDGPGPSEAALHGDQLLLVAFHDHGKFRRVAISSPDLLYCSMCGGAGGEIEFRIEAGKLLIEESSGSRGRTTVSMDFRYVADRHQFVLLLEKVDAEDQILRKHRITSFDFETGISTVQRVSGKRIARSAERAFKPRRIVFEDACLEALKKPEFEALSR